MPKEQEEAALPTWVQRKVVPATGERIRSIHLLKETGLRRTSLVFTETQAYLAERRPLMGVRMYEVELPPGILINGSNCPHCKKAIREPTRKVATLAKGAPKKAPAKRPPKTAPSAPAEPPAQRVVPKGKDVPVEEIEGIGATYVNRLEKKGIKTTQHLLEATPREIADAANAPIKSVHKWISMAELMRVKGLGKQYAELLVRTGIESVEALSKEDADLLADKVNHTMDSVEVSIQGSGVAAKRAAGWIKAAKKALAA